MRRHILLFVFFIVTVFAFFFKDIKTSLAATEPADGESIPVRVMLVIYDPILENYGNVRTHEYFSWNDPVPLSNLLVADLNSKSHGKVQYQIVQTNIRDEWPLHTNGQRYTDALYVQETNASNWTLGSGNYNAIITDNSIETKINNGEIDEVWMWGGPGFGWFEATTAGNGAYSTNGGPITGVNSKVFSIMGFNYERGSREAMESYGHRIEGIIKRIYGSWAFTYGPPPAQAPTIMHAWDQFTVKNYDPGSLIGCGFAHGSMNTPSYDQVNNYWAYDWTNTTTVASTCNDWYNYPYLTGATTNMNCSAWGCTAYGFHQWWWDHMPHANGTYDGYLANWWRYIADNDQYKDKAQISQLAVTTDFAENNSASWSCWADQSSCSLSNDTSVKKYGVSSVKMTTSGAFDNYMRYPSAQNANWNLADSGKLSFWAYATNTNGSGFQGSAVVHLKDSSGNGYTYTSTSDLWDQAVNSWKKFEIPFAGDSVWTRTSSGTPNLGDIDYVELHSDTWGAGFTLALDGLGFVTDYSERTVHNPPTYYNWDGYIDDGSFLEIHDGSGLTGVEGEREAEYYTDADGGVHSYYGSWNGFPGQGPLNANVTGKSLVFWVYSNNTNGGFESNSPTVRLRTGAYNGSDYYTYTPGSSLFNSTLGRWQRFEIPVDGNSTWTRTSSGSASLTDVDWIEFMYNTTGSASYRVYFDGVRFENNDAANPTVSITSPTGGSNVTGVTNVTVSAGDETAMKRVDLLVDGVYVMTDAMAPYVFAWDSAEVQTTGNHTLTAKAYDMSGRSATSSGVTVNVQVANAPIMSDAFETGTTGAWVEEDAESDLSVTTASALHNSWGMATVIDNTTETYIKDLTPADETRYRTRFYVDPNSLTMASSDNFTILQGRKTASAFQIHLSYSSSSGYRVRTSIYDDAAVAVNGNYVPITDAPHSIEVDWKASTAPGANNGYITLWVDGVQNYTQSGIDNDTKKVDEVRLGATQNLDAGTSGTIYFDDFVSRELTYVGALDTQPDLLFADGFESGNFSKWPLETDSENDLTVTTGSALSGTYGMSTLIDNVTSMYVSDLNPADEPRYRSRFYLDPNSISMVSGDTFNVFAGRDSSGSAFAIQLNYSSSSGYRVRTQIYDDAAVSTNGTWVNITDASHYIEIDWKASTAPGANNGYISLWVDGAAQGSQTGFDNDTKRVDEARMGAVANIDVGTLGTIYLDKYQANKTQAIGQ